MSSDNRKASDEHDGNDSLTGDSSTAQDAAKASDAARPIAEQFASDSDFSKIQPFDEENLPEEDELSVGGRQIPPSEEVLSTSDHTELPGGEISTAKVADSQSEVSGQQSTGEALATANYFDDPYADQGQEASRSDSDTTTVSTELQKPSDEASQKVPPVPPPPPPSGGGGDDEDEGMARMSFLEHLDELRTRILRALIGLGITYPLCLLFSRKLFKLVRAPYDMAREQLPQYDSPLTLVALTPVEQFHMLYLKIPILAAVFIASPWLMYQIWAFIAPGLYRKERRWAAPFVFSTATLFILGGLFGYFIMLRFALVFLLGIGFESDIQPMISISSYFNLFVALLLGLGLVFQMPVLIFSLTFLRITNPSFLLKNVRYAILIMFVIAAVITPTPDVANMTLFAAPMILLFYVGIGASYLLVWKRETGRTPWGRIAILVLLVVLLVLAAVLYYLHGELSYRFTSDFPWIVSP